MQPLPNDFRGRPQDYTVFSCLFVDYDANVDSTKDRVLIAFLSRPSAILSNIEIFLMLSLDICSMHESNRNVIFGRRAEGLLQKTNELSILCGVDIGRRKQCNLVANPRNLWVETA
ncbi:hypothetical protein Salat_1031900 [Sesamum alatum]|uniref:MADS-box domain-containing protein n=1 Tax=Sesamum alatum TaxID=300844 RepID=A0AAE1YME2_9LAMI|nr:hypothetical protein Salat_1031900 [Sesamum alatum]